MPKSWWEKLPELAKEYTPGREAIEMQKKFRGAYSLYGQDERVELEFLFFEEPSGRVRYEAFLDEDFIEEGFIDGDRVMDEIAERCYKALQEHKRLIAGYKALKEEKR